MGLMDLFKGPAERKRDAESQTSKSQDQLAARILASPKETERMIRKRGGKPVQLAAGAQGQAPSTPGGAVIVRAPSGLLVEHPWEPLRPEALLPVISAAVAADPQGGRLFADESGALLRYLQPGWAREDRLRYELGERYFTTQIVRAWPRDGASPRLWSPFYIELPGQVPDLTLSMHLWRIGTSAATRELKVQIDKRELELGQMIEKVGYDDARVVKMGEQIQAMRENLQSLIRQQETLFHVSAYLRVGAEEPEILRERVRVLTETARGMGLGLMAAPGEQRDAFVSSMPYAADPAYYTSLRGSDAAAALMPLITRPHQERNLRGKNPVVLYGMHMANYTPVMMSPWNSNETIEITTVLGRMGSGKSYWLRCHLGRLAMVGVKTITIDPLGDFVRWHEQNEGTIIEIAPGSDYHVNPFQRVYSQIDGALEPIEEKIERLMPMFQLVLGEEFDVIAQGLLQGGLQEFYRKFEGEERLMRDFIETLREFNRSSAGELSADTIRRRERLIDTLALKCLDGALRSFFEFKTNIDLDPKNPKSQRILFNLKPSGDGELMVFASYMAITMAANIAQSSMDRKIMLIDELHRLFMASKMATGIESFLRSFIRTHRHWNTALTFATQFVDEDDTNSAQENILKGTGTWILLRATEKMLEQSARLIGKDADLELMTQVLKISGATAEEARREAKPMIAYRAGEPVPMLSVGLSFEDKEDDKASGTKGAGQTRR